MSDPSPAGAATTPPHWDGVIDVASLHAYLDGPQLRILDCRHDLARPQLGEEQYAQGHIPGALFAHLDRDLSGHKTGGNGRHPLPERGALAARCAAWGISARTQVVVYDASEGSYAARAWWLLRWLGHPYVAVLDGGWPAWLAAGFDACTDTVAPAPGDFVPGAPLQALAELSQVVAFAQAALRGTLPRTLLLDARAPDRYAGRNETVDPVAGHIPGAVNRFWKDNLDAQGRFKSPAQLRAEYGALLADRGARDVILQCGSGVTACHDALALHRAGLPGAALYAGSWSEWVADAARPVAVGPAPVAGPDPTAG